MFPSRLLGALLLACALPLGGCSTVSSLEKAYSVAAGASITPTPVVIAGNTVDALQQTATNYLGSPLCKSGQTFLTNGCRAKVATQPIIAAVHSLRDARNNLEAFYHGHYTGPLGAQGLIDAVNAAVSTLQSTLKNYGVQS